jgi:vacuolar-type H+-ATPase subunit H
MPELRDFLARFRPAGAPGAARAGVPADRARELEAEVGPVLALLDGADAQCKRIIAQARRDAGQITAAAQAEAAVIAADAGRRAAAAREEAAQQVMTSAREDAASTVHRAWQQAARTRELARARMPVLVGRTVEAIRHLRPGDGEGGPEAAGT